MPKATRKSTADRVYDRLAADLPANAEVLRATVQCPVNPEDQLNVLLSVRDDPMPGMLARGHINKGQFDAGRKWQKHYEDSQIGSIQAIDPRRETVDGGGLTDPLPERQMKASRIIRDADLCLGDEGTTLVRDVLGGNLSIARAANRRGFFTAREINYCGTRFRECLESLRKLWGIPA